MPIYRRPMTGQIDDPAADYAEANERVRRNGYVDITVVTAASTSAQFFPHGLGKPYKGATVIWQTGLVPVYVGPPRAAGDASKRVVIIQGIAAVQQVMLRVF